MGISYYNAEHYTDPTAYEAIRNIERKKQRSSPLIRTNPKHPRTRVWRAPNKKEKNN